MEKSSNKAVFFDLDGTLLDTVPDICIALNETLRSFGYPEITEGDTRRFVGNGAAKLVERALPKGAPQAEFLAAFKVHYANAHVHTRTYEGAEACLRGLRAGGWKLAVVTNKPQIPTENVLNRFFPDTFDFIGADNGEFPVKPHPALTRYAAAVKLHVPAKNCLFVGDGETDVRTAIAAGMRPVCALWGYRSRAELEAAGGETFISSFPELLALAEKIAQNS